nr:MAG TPA: hypothetical protein [Caudoviricetes sp.]
MGFKQEAGIPKGRIVPMYLTDEGDLFPIFFKSMEELEMCGEMIGMVLNHIVPVDNKHPINSSEEKISIYDMRKKKIL